MLTPANIIRLYEHDTLREILQLQAVGRAAAFANAHRKLTLPELEEASDIIEDAANIDLTPKMIDRLLELYPIHRSYIIDSLGDTDANGILLSAVSQYFLNCDWPTIGDRTRGVDFDKFIAALHVAVPILRPLL